MTVFFQTAPVIEPPSGNRSEQYGPGSRLKRIIYEFPQILLIGPESRCIPFRIVFLGIIVSELYEQPVTRLQVGLDLVPQSPVYETLGTSAVLRVIYHAYGSVQMGRKSLAPASFRILSGKVLVCHSGVPHKTEGDFLSVLPARTVKAQAQKDRRD